MQTNHSQQTYVSDMPSNDYHMIPATDKQLRFARQIAARSSIEIGRASCRERV